MNLCGLIEKSISHSIEPDQILNLQDSLKFGGMKFPLVKGACKPLFRPVRISEAVHGESGLEMHEKVEFPNIPKHASDFTNRLNAQSTITHFTTKMYQYFRSFQPKKVENN